MARGVLLPVIIIHGLIHALGFVKAFEIAVLPRFAQTISGPLGVLWLVSGLLFIVAAAPPIMGKDWWWMAAVPALLLSQALIIASWHDAGFGTIAKGVILVATVAGVGLSVESSMLNGGKEGCGTKA